eukprot:1644982-Pleurochrysis_carterae.AAC.1
MASTSSFSAIDDAVDKFDCGDDFGAITRKLLSGRPNDVGLEFYAAGEAACGPHIRARASLVRAIFRMCSMASESGFNGPSMHDLHGSKCSSIKYGLVRLIDFIVRARVDWCLCLLNCFLRYVLRKEHDMSKGIASDTGRLSN